MTKPTTINELFNYILDLPAIIGGFSMIKRELQKMVKNGGRLTCKNILLKNNSFDLIIANSMTILTIYYILYTVLYLVFVRTHAL
jgi:hypothetical protein